MRLIQIVPSIEPRYGGPSVSVPKLAGALADLGHDVELLATAPGGGETRRAGALQVRIFARDWPESICASAGLARHLRAVEYDTIHSHGLWLRPLHYAHRCALQRGVPHVISPRGMMNQWAWHHNRWRKAFAEMILHPGALHHATGWHATSAGEAEEIRALGFKQPVCLAPNGVAVALPAEEEAARTYWRERCPEAFARPTALFYSRFHRKKRVLELIDLWLAHAPREWLLLLVGIPQEYTVEQLQSYVLRNSGGGRVLVHDGTEAPPPYAAASLFLLPSHSENFGLVVAEALAHGLPVFVTDTTPWQALNATDYGWCGPWEHYREALLAALALGPDRLRARGAAARAWVVREYSWEKSARWLADFYASLRR